MLSILVIPCTRLIRPPRRTGPALSPWRRACSGVRPCQGPASGRPRRGGPAGPSLTRPDPRAPIHQGFKVGSAPTGGCSRPQGETMQTETVCVSCSAWTTGSICSVCGAEKPHDAPKRYVHTPAELSRQAAIAHPNRTQAPLQAAPSETGPRVACPKCKSTQFSTGAKGYGLGKATLGFLAIGPVGLAAGAIGSSRLLITCLACGHRWKPGK